jgi:hypothetical protein
VKRLWELEILGLKNFYYENISKGSRIHMNGGYLVGALIKDDSISERPG